MLNWIIDYSLRHRLLVIVAALVAAGVGAIALRNLNIDAFPDTTPVQVQINTVAPALGAEEVERQITYAVEQQVSGMPGLADLRSVSKFGLSQVVATFAEGTDNYFARQQVSERLNAVELPLGVGRPNLGPPTTGLGEVFHYLVVGRGTSYTDLRTVQDWTVKPPLKSLPGVAEVNSWGGGERQYQVRIDPARLIKFGLTLGEVVEAVERNNGSVGGGNISQSGGMLLVQGLGRTIDTESIRAIVVAAHDGVPVRVGDLGEAVIGHQIRRGAATADGRGEVVLGLGFMLMGENSHEVTARLKDKLAEVAPTLPAGTQAVNVYDRSELVDFVIDTARKNLLEGGLLVVAVLFACLGNLRAALIVALAIPLSMLFAFAGMWRFGISASLMSLGAIDFGMVVDSSVVMVENVVRHLAHAPADGLSRLEIVRRAAIEVRKPTMFGELIIMIVYLPILTLEGVEGKLFRPMALTVIFALAGSMVLSLTLMPVLASLCLPRRLEHREPLVMRLIKWLYTPVLRFSLHYRFAVLAVAAALLGLAFGVIAPQLGAEFVPQLSEGAVAINIVRLAGTDLDESVRYNTQMERVVRSQFPDEVAHVWSRIGTADVATDPMGVELTDMFISLRPREQWKKAASQAELAELIERELRRFPGQRLSFSQPIQMRLNEMVSGVKAAVAVKLYGDDFDVLNAKAAEIARVLEKSVAGSSDVTIEQLTGQPVLQIKMRQDQLARSGVPAQAVLDLIETIGGKSVGEVAEGQLRFPLAVRLPKSATADPRAIGLMQVATTKGERIPLSRLADIELVEGPATISRDWGQRRTTITCNVTGRDLAGFVNEAQRKVAEQVRLPAGRYRLEWGGQFENLDRARLRLLIVVPVALSLIFLLLYATYRNVLDALRVFSGVPFAWVGGVIALWVRDMPFSISAGVGFVALSGVAVLDDMILVSYIRQLRGRGMPLDQAVEQAALTRLRPVLMTTLVACLGFLPMALSTGMGAEVQRPLATVVVGGVISAMVMSLLVLRAMYLVFDRIGGALAALGNRLGIRSKPAATAEAEPSLMS